MRTFLGSFLFRGEAVFKSLNQLSGGEKSRVALARLVRRGTNVLVLDEPTNHLDLESRQVMEAALKAFTGTIVASSHDRSFLASVVDRVIELSRDGCRVWEGGYEQYAEKRRGVKAAPVTEVAKPKRKKEAPEPAVDAKGTRKQSHQAGKARKREEQKLRRRVAKAESEVMQLEKRKESLHMEMADPAVATDVARMTGLDGDLKGLERTLAEAMTEWERLAGRLDAFLDGVSS